MRGRMSAALVSARCMEIILGCLQRVLEKEGQTGLDAVTLPAFQVLTKLATKGICKVVIVQEFPVYSIRLNIQTKLQKIQ